ALFFSHAHRPLASRVLIGNRMSTGGIESVPLRARACPRNSSPGGGVGGALAAPSDGEGGRSPPPSYLGRSAIPWGALATEIRRTWAWVFRSMTLTASA